MKTLERLCTQDGRDRTPHEFSPYSAVEKIAAEYYDRARHPTCANFSDLQIIIRRNLSDCFAKKRSLLEVCSGRGELDLVSPGSRVLFTDISQEMLALARRRVGPGCRTKCFDAVNGLLLSELFDGAAAFLPDAVNRPRFYHRMRRLLRPKSILAVTLPNFIWASALRTRLGFAVNETRFILRDGHTVTVASSVYPVAVQAEMFSAAGFRVLSQSTLCLNAAPFSSPSHHVQLAAKVLGCDARHVPLLDLWIATPYEE